MSLKLKKKVRQITSVIELTYFGDPVAQGRPRFSRFGGAYDPPKSKAFKECLAKDIGGQYHGELIDKPFRLELDIYRRNNKKTSKKEIDRREKKLSRPIVKPDTDNYAKGTIDGLTGVLWTDDNKMVELEAKKYYSVTPRIEIRVEEVDYE